VTLAGAPVPPPLVARPPALLPEGGDVHTPSGATEALPVTSVSGAELADGLAERTARGEGTCVGRPAPGIELRLIAITDDPLATWDETRPPAPGEPGEVCVRGAVVTREYADAPAATAAAKIVDGASVWHRMGDVGRFDAEGRLWFLGRKAHRVQTEHGLLMPVPVENVFNRCDGVRRTALVGVGPAGRERPWLVVEPEEAAREPELLERLRAIAPSAPARVDGFLFHPAFPVDVRHNAKIRREDLKVWAAGRLR
jgi:acyl-CoA synthetase (AMP-forming)/AMP-acid ligase II